MAQDVHRVDDRAAIQRKDRARQRVRRSLIAQLQRFVVLRLRIDVDRQHRAENLLDHQLGLRLFRQHNRGLDEVAGRIITPAADEDLHVRAAAGELDVPADIRERAFVDHGAHEVSEISHVPHLQLGNFVQHALLHIGPEGIGNVSARRGGALLALVFERSSDHGRGQGGGVGAAVGEDKVLAAGLADDAWVTHVLADIRPDRQPDGGEHVRAAGEVDAAEVGVIQRRGRDD